jgi:flagellar basal-body rod protein FlgF
MIKALLSSGQAMAVQAKRHELIANNLANVNTPGFQKLISQVRTDLPSGADGQFTRGMQQPVVTSVSSTRSGPMRATGNPLDVGIAGEGYFLIDTPQGERLTRDGSLSLNSQGELVHSSGFPILAGGSVMVIRDAPSIMSDGSVMDGNKILGRLTVVRPNSSDGLRREGGNLLDAVDGYVELPTDSIRIASGHLEGSNVEAVEEMVTMIRAFRAYEIAQRSAQAADEILRIAVQRIGTLRA